MLPFEPKSSTGFLSWGLPPFLIKPPKKAFRSIFKMAKYVGLELSGAKNQKTALAVLEYFPREKKLFLLHLRDGIGPEANQSGDEVLLRVLSEIQKESKKKNILMGV